MKQRDIDQIRAFNRHYTQALGLLNKGILNGKLALSEIRVMREIYFNPHTTPSCIAKTLHIDKGFLSRIIKQFEKSGYILKERSEKDNRAYFLHLTEAGRLCYEKINNDSDAQIEKMFADFSVAQLKAAVQSFNTIHSLFKDKNNHSITDPIIIRPIEEKDNEALAVLIRRVFDEFDAPRKGSVYDDPNTDRLYQYFQQAGAEYWVVESNHTILGGCGFYPTKGLPTACAEVVKFYLLNSVRGRNIGSYIFNMIEERAKKTDYRQLYLESFDIFHHAVRLYERLGYKHLNGPLGDSGHCMTTIHMLKNIG